jgi:iron complex outermembrane recepter protein
MSSIHLASVSALALSAFLTPAFAQNHDAALQDVITVTGVRMPTEIDAIEPNMEPDTGPDAAALAVRLPGAALIGNGALSGQVQYRGLFGSRLNIRIDGQSFASGGPNLMDPPFHYAPAPLLAAIEVDRGISPVSDGPGLAGGVNAILKRVDFASAGEAVRLRYDLAAGGRSADSSYFAGGIVGTSSDTWRMHVLLSNEKGNDVDFPGGTIGGSEHLRTVYGAGLGWQSSGHEFGLDLRRQETGATGNPPFPMDIRYFNTDFAQAFYAFPAGEMTVRVEAGYTAVDHAMNNFDLRPAPPAMQQRETYANSESRTLSLDAVWPQSGAEWRFGIDHQGDDHATRITNPNAAGFFLDSFPSVDMQRTGAFAEWRGDVSGWDAELGVRTDFHTAHTGLARTGPMVPAMPGMLASAFNAEDRETDEQTVDLAARVWRREGDMTWRFTLARKTRIPGYVERFAWLPTGASGGLADGNTYVGDLSLEPEVAYIAEAGFDWNRDGGYFRPTVFMRHVDDYIQGVPFDATPGVIDTPVEMVSNMNGDPTPLRFSNVDARLYGLDFDFGYAFDQNWRMEGVFSYVRGERRDIDDNLYRIAPTSLRMALTRDAVNWSVGLEALAVAEQDDVSATNSEASTEGYVIFGVSGDWQIREGATLLAGVSNLLDHRYERHLAGYNRNAGSDVAVGARLPGEGRSLWLRLHFQR